MNDAEKYRVRVSAAVIRPRDELLVVRESRRAIAVVNLPGGSPHIDETLQQAVAREVLEETGYVVIPTEIAFVAERRSDRWDSSELEVCFYAQIASQASKAPMSGDGEQIVEWLPLDHPDVRARPYSAVFRARRRGRFVDEALHAKR